MAALLLCSGHSEKDHLHAAAGAVRGQRVRECSAQALLVRRLLHGLATHHSSGGTCLCGLARSTAVASSVQFSTKRAAERRCNIIPICRYELFIDDLPVWDIVGPPPEETKDDDNIYIYTHKNLDVAFNENRVRASSVLSATCLSTACATS